MSDEGGGGHGGGGTWLISYADMVTLLLAFFIVMYTMSQVDAQKLQTLVNSLSKSFNPQSGGNGAGIPTGPTLQPDVLGDAGLVSGGSAIPALAPPRAGTGPGGSGGTGGTSRADRDLEEALSTAKAITREMGMEGQASARLDGRGVVVSFGEQADNVASVVPFESGSAALTPGFRAFLDRIAPVLKQCTNKVEIQGHTDRRPIRSAAYPSNWELSGARAGAVARYFVARHGLHPKQLVVTGFADTLPLDPADTPAAWARNRRIEIVITRHPIGSYDAKSRADVGSTEVDITDPLGEHLVPTGLPETDIGNH